MIKAKSTIVSAAEPSGWFQVSVMPSSENTGSEVGRWALYCLLGCFYTTFTLLNNVLIDFRHDLLLPAATRRTFLCVVMFSSLLRFMVSSGTICGYIGGHHGCHPSHHHDTSRWSFQCGRDPEYDRGFQCHKQFPQRWRHHQRERDITAKLHTAQRHLVPAHHHGATSDRPLQGLADKPDAHFRLLAAI